MNTTAGPTSELGIILETRTEQGILVRRWAEPWISSLDAEWLDKLADQQSWDYETHGKTETFIMLPAGELPLSALRVTEPRLVAEGIKSFDGEPLAYMWWLFAGRIEPAVAIEAAEQAKVPPQSVGSHGAGQPFANKPWVRSTRTRTLVTQRVGLDV